MADSTTVVAVTESTTVQVVDGDATVVQTGVPTDLTTSGGGGGVTDASYVTLGTNGTLTDERVLTAGSGITITDGGAGSTVTVAVTANTFQPVDSDLTAIAALSTTSFGRGLLALADAAALRTSAGLVIGTDIYSKAAVDSGFQPLDSDLTAIAALTTTPFGRSLLALADAAAARSALGLGGAAVLNVGTTTGTVAAGDDSRITGAAQKAANLSDVADAATAFGNIKQAATTSATGVVELATAAETTTGTDATRAVTPDGLAGSEYGVEVVGIMASDMSTAITTGDGKAGFMVPTKLNGWNLIRANAGLLAAQSSSGTPTVQIRRVRSGTPADMLSTKITIDANESTSHTAATPPVIDTANDDVATGDLIYVDVDVAGTGAKGLIVNLSFQAP